MEKEDPYGDFFHCCGCPWGSPVPQRGPCGRAIILSKRQNLLKSYRFRMGGLQEQMQMLNPERSFCFFKNKTLNQSITLVGRTGSADTKIWISSFGLGCACLDLSPGHPLQ